MSDFIEEYEKKLSETVRPDIVCGPNALKAMQKSGMISPRDRIIRTSHKHDLIEAIYRNQKLVYKIITDNINKLHEAVVSANQNGDKNVN